MRGETGGLKNARTWGDYTLDAHTGSVMKKLPKSRRHFPHVGLHSSPQIWGSSAPQPCSRPTPSLAGWQKPPTPSCPLNAEARASTQGDITIKYRAWETPTKEIPAVASPNHINYVFITEVNKMENQLCYKYESWFTSRYHSSFVKSRIPVDRNLGLVSKRFFNWCVTFSLYIGSSWTFQFEWLCLVYWAEVKSHADNRGPVSTGLGVPITHEESVQT